MMKEVQRASECMTWQAPPPNSRKYWANTPPVQGPAGAYLEPGDGPDAPSSEQVLSRLGEIADTVAVHEVMGPYDVVVQLECDTYEDMVATVHNKIRPIDGVRTTGRCPWMT